MAGVFCPSCEASAEATAKFCLSCGHDFVGQGPITSTGHDLNQLKDVIRQRDDLSMADKFDMIAKIEEGANPIQLGIAAPAEGDEEVDIGAAFATEEVEKTSSSNSDYSFGESVAASAAVRAVTKVTEAWTLIQDGKLDMSDPLFKEAMALGMEASTHIHDVASGEHEGIDAEAMRAIPVLKPPKRSFCPKCGSDIHANTMMQWRKWRDGSGEVISMQLEASMETALIQVAAHYVNAMNTLELKLNQLSKDHVKAKADLEELDEDKIIEELSETLREEIEAELRKELSAEYSSGAKGRSAASSGGGGSRGGSSGSPTKKSPAKKKKAGGMMFGKKTPKMTFEGAPEDKAERFLTEALETVYDPHGSGKKLKRKTIVARSSDGNVRVQDVVSIYAAEGEDGLSELAWTSPLTKYIIEAFNAC